MAIVHSLRPGHRMIRKGEKAWATPMTPLERRRRRRQPLEPQSQGLRHLQVFYNVM